MKTKLNNILRGGGLLAALFLMGTSSAYAATAADTDVTNTATVTFRTATGGAVDQAGVGDAETFETDLLVNLTVVGGSDTDVAPGQGASFTLVRSFTVTNTSNGAIDILLSTFDDTVSVDDFDTGGLNILWDVGADAYDGDETDSDTLTSAAAGATYTVHVVTTAISSAVTNLQQDRIYLKAQAAGSGGGGAITADSASDGVLVVDNVVEDGDGDGAGTDDAARDGAHSDVVAYIVRTAAIALTKSSFAIYDPVNCSATDGAQNLTPTCTDTAFRIPGARIVYKLIVANPAATSEADATLVNITDTLDGASTTYIAGTLWRIAVAEGAAAGQTCYSGGAALTDADTNDDAGGVTGDVVSFDESTGLTEGNAVVYCYKVSID